MKKKGIVIAANFGLDPALAMALITSNITQVRKNTINSASVYDEENEPSPLMNYFIPEDYICEDLQQIINHQELLILIGYPEEPQLLNLIEELSEKLVVMFIGNRCSTYLTSKLIEGTVDTDYLQAAAKWCLDQGITLRKSVLNSCQGDKEIADEIIQRYEAAWLVVFNIDMKDLKEQAVFHLEFVEEIMYGDASDYIEKKLELRKKMLRETRRLANQVQDLGNGIGIIKTGSKPFFKAQVLTAIKGGYLVKIVEYIKKLEIEHLVFYDLKTTKIAIGDVQTKKGPFDLGVIGKN